MNDIDEILMDAKHRGASDVHIATGYPLAFRINGDLVYQSSEVLSAEEAEELIMPVLKSNIVNREKFQQNGEVDMAYTVEKSRYRVNVYKQRGTMAAAMRLIPETIPNIVELGLPASVLQFVEKTKGLVLVTGPTGSGKSTTLASMIDYISKNRKSHIITLEDPIEYVHKFNKSIINQREVEKDTDSFASGLKSSLREDPDVVMVGEMRDLETIATAITAAETGHLVLSTLHTMSAPQTIERIVDVFPPNQQAQVRFQLSMILNGIISQQLIERKDKKGRVLASEILVSNTATNNLIREGNTHQIKSIIQTRSQEGMQTMDDSLMDLYGKGLIGKEDVLKYSQDTSYVKNRLGI
ncbi:MAG TPA: type IV pili twitching motility protein PilT [Clostridiales bacterium]|nr:MAG: type IV pili twitching motility protein PilT [Clostridiales bacterium GWD2_32_19]HCC07446.1 type IV pili twitching motility protein PilT [Clostridiales bacterium]